MTSKLFSPASLRKALLPNRIVVSPMAQYSASEDGCSTPWHHMHVGNLLVSGAGLTIMEATAVEPRGRVSNACLGLWSDSHVPGLKQIVDFGRAYGGGAIGIQLAHAGRKASVSVPWKGQESLSENNGGWQTVSSSNAAYPGRTQPLELTKQDMPSMVQYYIEATIRAEQAGFDLIELHCAHGYLLHSFLSPISNTRTDQYGGCIDGRMRFPLEVFKAIRRVWHHSKPLGVRVSATDWIENGWDINDTIIFAKKLEQLGCDYISVSSGGTLPVQQIPVGPGYQVSLAAKLRKNIDLPVMAVGLITDPVQAETILATDQADFIALGRTMLHNPRWSWDAAASLRQTINLPPQYMRGNSSMRSGDPLKAVQGK